jgi:hypothetical protein
MPDTEGFSADADADADADAELAPEGCPRT